MIFRFWRRRSSAKMLHTQVHTQGHAETPDISHEPAAEKRRTGDTDGTFRRMRQTVEDNRLL